MSKLFENLWVKIASILLAILLWFHVATEKIYQNNIYLPLTEIDITSDFQLVEAPPDSILVTVAATGKRLLRTDWKKRGLKLLLNRNHPGRFRVEITHENLSLVNADKVDLVSILGPREITLSCDRKIQKEIPVICKVVINPDEGFAVTTADSIIPSTVLVTGPTRTMANLKILETEQKILEGVRNNFTRKVALTIPDEYGLKFEPDSVVAFVGVVPVKRKSYSDIGIELINVPSTANINWQIEPKITEIAVSGQSELIDTLRIEYISAIADFALRDSIGFMPVQIILPPLISLESQSVESVKIQESQ